MTKIMTNIPKCTKQLLHCTLHRRFSSLTVPQRFQFEKIWDFGSQHKPSSPTIARRECCSSAWNCRTPTAGHFKKVNQLWPKNLATETSNQWIGLRENLQESPIFNGKIYGFRFRFSLKPIHWSNVQWKLRGKCAILGYLHGAPKRWFLYGSTENVHPENGQKKMSFQRLMLIKAFLHLKSHGI